MPILNSETERKVKERSLAYLKVVCFKCKKEYEFPGLFQATNKQKSGLVCQNPDCSQLIQKEYLKNRVNLFIKQLLTLYYEGINILNFLSFQ